MRKKQALRINWKRIKKIPKLFIVFWFLLGIFSLVFLGDLPRSPYHSLENLQVKEITVDSARITRTFNMFSTMRLEIISDGNEYYLYYDNYRDYADCVESELLSGKVSTVTVKIVAQQSLSDRIRDRIHMVDVRSETTVFFDIENEKEILQEQYIASWIAFLIFSVLWIGCTIFDIYVYKLVEKKNFTKKDL